MEQLISKIREDYNLPLFELISKAHLAHLDHFKPGEIQASSLINIKSGGCTENCSYCSQSVHNMAKVNVHKLMPKDEILQRAMVAKDVGATRICLGAAWREVRDNRDFETVLSIVESVSNLDVEVCCTLGMLSEDQALKLKKAGLTSYNHNLDTSETYYNKIVTTRDYQDRISTLQNARNAGLKLCSGGILGLGESVEDRIQMIATFAAMTPPPESIPINLLVPIEGTPLESQVPTDHWELLRAIAATRVHIQGSYIRLSAGRHFLSHEMQTLCFFAGANSIFLGEQLLTTENASEHSDKELFKILGIKSVTA